MPTPTADAPARSGALTKDPLSALIRPAPRPLPPQPQPQPRPRPRPREKRSPRRVERLARLGPEGRLAAYRSGTLSRAECWEWARRFPDEVPIVNGELDWVARGLADLD
jgi:hypothetical protein